MRGKNEWRSGRGGDEDGRRTENKGKKQKGLYESRRLGGGEREKGKG